MPDAEESNTRKHLGVEESEYRAEQPSEIPAVRGTEGYLGEPRAPSLTQLKERERVQGCRTAAVRLLVPAETNDHRLGADNRKYSLQFWLPEI